MALLIAPVDVAAQITDILAGASSEDDNRGLLVRAALDRTVQYNGEEVPIRSFMVGGEITDGSDQWGVHSGDYTVRAGQYVSRFFFLALSSGKGTGARATCWIRSGSAPSLRRPWPGTPT